jgi:hypothetical protein
MISARSPLNERSAWLQSRNATRAENSLLYALRANSAPVVGSSSVTTYGALAARLLPKTSS